MSRKILVVIVLLIFVVIATGCMDMEAPIDPERGIWDKYFVYPLSWALEYFAKLFNPNGDPAYDQYGWSIVLVTILLRLLTLPLMVKQLKSSKMMQALQPEMTQIREKYAKDQQKMQQETMALFQKHNVNPLAGCLPIFVQMPILIAFYHAIFRHHDIPGHTFLLIPLDEPFWLLAIIAGITTYLQQKMMGTQANPQMRMLMVILPIMITVFGFMFPAALTLYWVIGNLFTIVQTYFIKDKYKIAQEGAKK